MRRTLLFLLVATGSLILSSCLIIEERISLNKDGSGQQVTTVDMSGMLENTFVQMTLAEEFEKGENPDLKGKMDSSFRVADQILPFNPQWSAAEKALISRVTGNITVDIEEGVGLMTTTFAFNNIEEVEQLAVLMSNANKPDDLENNPLSGISGGNFLLSSMAIKGSKFTRETEKAPNYINPMKEAEGFQAGTADMMKEMFGDAVIIYQVDFPGKIKKVKGFAGHEVEGNSLVMMFDFMELLEAPETFAETLSGEVKFKK